MPRRPKSHSMPVGTRPFTGKSARKLAQHTRGRKREATGFTMVTFHVRADLGHGEKLGVVGNVGSLGSNNLDRHVELTTTPSTYPVFSSIPDIPVRTGSRVTYFLAIYSGGVFKRWITDEDSPIAPITEGDHDDNEDEHSTVPAEVILHPRKTYTFVASDPFEMDVSVVISLADNKNNPNFLSSPTTPSTAFNEDVSREVKMRKSNSQQGLHNLHMSTKPSRAQTTNVRSVVVVVQHLPVQIRRLEPTDPTGRRFHVRWNDEATLSKETAEYAASRKMRIQWLGQLPADAPAVTTQSDRIALARALLPFHCQPVYLDEDVAYHHNLFVTDTLFPLFHNVVQAFRKFPTRWWAPERHQLAWRSYHNACRAYGQRVVELYNDGDLIWIHSLHFLLLPSYIARRTLSRARVGLFLHLPFPSSEVFRTLSMRAELLQAMLNADQIGFHTYEYARHFNACCRRILGQCSLNDTQIHPGHMLIENQGHNVSIVVAHAGIEASTIEAGLKDPAVHAHVQRIRAKYKGRRIVLGIDTIQTFAGVDLKFLAFAKLLAQNPRLVHSTVFVQILITRPAAFGTTTSAAGRQDVGGARKHTRQVRRDLLNLAANLNARFHLGGKSRRILEVIEYSQPELSLAARIAWMMAADVLVCGAVREGFNRIPLEFVAAQFHKPGGTGDGQGRRPEIQPQNGSEPSQSDANISQTNKRIPHVLGSDTTGVLIVSEVCSCSRVLPGALTVNPASQDLMVQSLLRALELKPSERRRRNDVNAEWVIECTTSRWATSVLQNLGLVEKKSGYLSLGLGLSYRYMAESQNVQRLVPSLVNRTWKRAKKKLLLLDLRGTLVSDDKLRARPRSNSANPSVPRQRTRPLGSHSRHHGRLRHTHNSQAPTISAGKPPKSSGSAEADEYAHLRPSEKMLARLNLLAADPRTVVAVISGLEMQVMESLFKGAGNLHLLAEHGFHHRRPQRDVSPNGSSGNAHPATKVWGQSGGNGAGSHGWYTIRLNLDNSWRSAAIAIMNTYVDRTAGSSIKEKASTIIWEYESADPEFGAEQANDLQANLAHTLRHFNLDILNGKGYVEIRHRGLTKGAAVQRLINEFQCHHGNLEAIVCMGDDTSDETMFVALENDDGTLSPDCTVITCTVGRKVSAANFFVYDTTEVSEIIDSLTIASMRGKKWSSDVDLVGMVPKGAHPAPSTKLPLPGPIVSRVNLDNQRINSARGAPNGQSLRLRPSSFRVQSSGLGSLLHDSRSSAPHRQHHNKEITPSIDLDKPRVSQPAMASATLSVSSPAGSSDSLLLPDQNGLMTATATITFSSPATASNDEAALAVARRAVAAAGKAVTAAMAAASTTSDGDKLNYSSGSPSSVQIEDVEADDSVGSGSGIAFEDGGTGSEDGEFDEFADLGAVWA